MSERVIEPLEMSDTEILDWLEENYYSLNYYTASQAIVGGHKLVYGYQDEVFERTVRTAVRKAAALDKESNQ